MKHEGTSMDDPATRTKGFALSAQGRKMKWEE